jgi:tetratricopeptide (TPR) repeat protein
LEAAAEHYRKAVLLTSKISIKLLALNLLAESYAAHALNDPGRAQAALWEIIRLTPDDLAPVYRLSKFLEDQGFFDAAEQTLLGARQQRPDEVEPYVMLAEFYSRRADMRRKETHAKSTSSPGTAQVESKDGVDGLRNRALVEETLRRTLGTDTR